MLSLKEAALDYANRGWPVFPCNSIKEPLVENGVLEATTDPAKIEAWWNSFPRANIGFAAGEAGFMVLDFDPGSDLAQLRANLLGDLPATKLRAKTPRGGEHWFYALNPGEIVSPSASKLSPHVDVRSFNSYVLLWPSRTSDGEYEWIEEGKPTHRTDEMVRQANTHREKSGDRDNWIIQPDLQENIVAAIDWLKTKAKVSIQHQGGDNNAYATAAMMKSFGISQELAFDLMWEHWNPRCSPPWTADEVEHFERKIINGYSYNTSPPGNVTSAYRVARQQQMFKPVERELPSGVEYTSGKFRFVDREGMHHVRPPDWLICDFLPQGAYALLVGAPGTFKTFLALDIALSVATGTNFPWAGLWHGIGDSGPCLFTLGEGRSEFTKRVQAWERTYWNGKPVTNIILGDPVPLVSAGDAEWDAFFNGALAASPDGYKLVVLDTVGRSMQGLNENAQEHASAFTRRVEECQRNLGATVLALHHTGYDKTDRARGSSVFLADPDTVVTLERPGKEYVITATMNKQKDAPEWQTPKLIQLNEVSLPDKVKSLVVAPAPENKQAPAVERAVKEKQEKVQEMFTMSALDKEVVAVLKSNPAKKWKQGELAAAVAMRPSISIGSEMLRKYLTKLREDKTTHAHHCFDPSQSQAIGQWRYKDKASA